MDRYPLDTDALLGFLDIVKTLHADDEQALQALESVRIYVSEVTAPDELAAAAWLRANVGLT